VKRLIIIVYTPMQHSNNFDDGGCLWKVIRVSVEMQFFYTSSIADEILTCALANPLAAFEAAANQMPFRDDMPIATPPRKQRYRQPGGVLVVDGQRESNSVD